jgi:hypothetical protein
MFKVASKGPTSLGRILHAANATSPGLLAATSLLTIYACAGLTRHFVAYCFKPVTGLNVSRTFTSATAATASPGTGRVICRSVCSREAAECAYILRVYLHTCQQKQILPASFGGHPEQFPADSHSRVSNSQEVGSESDLTPLLETEGWFAIGKSKRRPACACSNPLGGGSQRMGARRPIDADAQLPCKRSEEEAKRPFGSSAAFESRAWMSRNDQ